MAFSVPAALRRLLETEYPRFSRAEINRRRAAIAAVMSEAEVDHLIYYGVNRTGTAVEWLTQWPVTAEAAGVLTPGEPDALFVQYFNHVPLARRLAEQAEVAWGGNSSIASVIAALERRAARPGGVGIVGPLTFEQHEMLSARFGALVNLNRPYLKLRTIKSAEEIDWLRLGAAFSDAGMAALESALQPGLSERALADAIERAYVAAGGTTVIHYIGATPMRDPKVEVPAQFPSSRRVEPGDIVVAEIAAAFWGYAGQVLRSFAVAEEPPALYRELHEVADAAFDAITAVLKHGAHPADVVAAAGVEAGGFTTCDDLLHGYGGGYLPPVLGSASRPAGLVPDELFEAGMTVVIQPNVVSRDHRAGVQTGELVLITANGIEPLHRLRRGFLRV